MNDTSVSLPRAMREGRTKPFGARQKPWSLYRLSFCLASAILLTGCNQALAEQDVAEDLSDPEGGGDSSLDAMDACFQATESLRNNPEDTALQAASQAYSDAMVSRMTDEEWSFGFPQDATDAYQEACEAYNNDSVGDDNGGVVWKAVGDSGTFACDMPQMSVTGETVELYGIGECLADTSDCQAVTPEVLTERLWEKVGLECSVPSDATGDDASTTTTGNDADTENDGAEDAEIDGASSTGEGESEESAGESTGTAASEEGNTEDLAPGDEDDAGDRLPFLTDEDVACNDQTAEFVDQNSGLASAVGKFQDSQMLKVDQDDGVDVFGFPVEPSKAMKAACELNKGYWAFVKSMNFTCIIEGMETVPLHAHNFGKCLAKTDECLAMNTTSVLRQELSALGFNCWEDNTNESSGSSGGEDASPGTGESDESGGETEDASEGENEDPAEGGIADQDSDPNIGDKDEDSGNTKDETSAPMDGLGLSESDEKCMGDTMALGIEHPDLGEAIQAFGSSMDVEMGDVENMTIGFPEENVEKLKSVCEDSSVGGYFTVIKEEEFICDVLSVEAALKVTNIANCLADTKECKKMNSLLLMENIWKSVGLSCREKKEAEEDDSSSSSMNDTKGPDDGNENDESGGDDSLAGKLGLQESEKTCMADSTNFIDSSEVLANATAVYQKSVNMKDSTRLGFSKSSASEMEQVCEEQGGLWSFIKAEDVTCKIQGRDRCIQVYNFGNCISNSDECQNMDPMVLVKGFFMEVLNFSCRAKCDKHKDTAGHSPSSAPHKNSHNGSNNLSSQQESGKSIAGFDLPSFTTLVVAACVLVGAIGLLGIIRYKARGSRQRSYEMTDISDLRFDSISEFT